MRFSKRGNVLLLELLIVIAFFMLGATILMRMFGTARYLNLRSDALTRSAGRTASMADELMAAPDAAAALAGMGAEETPEGYSLSEEDITYIVTFENKDDASVGRQGQVSAFWRGEQLMTFPVVCVEDPAGAAG